MADLNDVCDGLAQVVETIDGLHCKGWVDDQVHAPEGHVFHRPHDPRFTQGGSPKRVHALGVRVYVPRTDTHSAQKLLREYMGQDGDRSIRRVVENGDLWTVDVDDAEVTQIGAIQEGGSATAAYLYVDFDIDVIF